MLIFNIIIVTLALIIITTISIIFNRTVVISGSQKSAALMAAENGNLVEYKCMCLENSYDCKDEEKREFYKKEYLFLCSDKSNELWEINNKNKMGEF